MKKFYKNFPIETYVLLIPSVVFILIVIIFVLFHDPSYALNLFNQHFLSLFTGVNIILPVIFLVFLISSIVILSAIKDPVERFSIVSSIRSPIFLIGAFCIIELALAISLQFILNMADPLATAKNSIMFARWDYVIFGTYPWLSLHSFIKTPLLQKFIYESYLSLYNIIFLISLIFAFKNVLIFRKLFMSLCIVIILGMPFWIMFPALAPDIMYRSNILNVPVETKLQERIESTDFSETTKPVLLYLEKFWIDKSKQSLPVSSFPSMHAAWGVILAVLSIELWAPLGFILVPWVLAELIGTVLTLQHYAVDVIFGIILAFIALYLTSVLLKYDKEKNFNQWDLFNSLNKLGTYPKSFWSWIKKK